ncbi:MAG: hypothetical protein MUC93_08840 [Bacteroidales bacterium]|nr:hypothetical protein [Bacteroidales bacterium]
MIKTNIKILKIILDVSKFNEANGAKRSIEIGGDKRPTFSISDLNVSLKVY